jgi:hypothetical protein
MQWSLTCQTFTSCFDISWNIFDLIVEVDELPSFKYFMLPKVQAKKGSKSWNCVGTSWKALSKLRRKIGYTIMPSSYATSQRHYGNDMFIIVGRARVKFDLKASKA